MEDKIAKIIVTTETYKEYYEDYRSGGWHDETRTVYKCGYCKKYLNNSDPKFCEHCGREFKGKIEK